MCGTSDWEWLADVDAYRPVLRVCIGCQRKATAETQLNGQEPRPGTTVTLVSRTEAERLDRDPTVARHGPRLKRRRRSRQGEQPAD